MNRWLKILGTALVESCLLASSGCGHLVSKKEFINTSFSQANARPRADTALGAVPPARRVIDITAKPGREDEPAVATTVDHRSSTMQTGEWASWRDRAYFESEVRNEIAALDRYMAELQSRANQKGTTGSVAFGSKDRFYRADVDALNSDLADGRNDRWESTPVGSLDVTRTWLLLRDIRRDVADAELAVERVAPADARSAR